MFYFDHIVIISPQSLTVSCLRMSIHVDHPLISARSHICLLLLKLKNAQICSFPGRLGNFSTGVGAIRHLLSGRLSLVLTFMFWVQWGHVIRGLALSMFSNLFWDFIWWFFHVFSPILLKMSQCWTSLPGVIIVWLIHQQLWWCYQHESQVMIRRATSYSHFQRAPRRGDEVTSNINLVKCKLTQTCVDEIHNFSRFWLDEILI